MINISSNAFDDVRQAFDRALASPKGIRIVCSSRAAAVRQRQRMTYWRAQSREQAGAEHRSPYDHLRLRLPAKGGPEEAILYIEPRRAEDPTIEEIL